MNCIGTGGLSQHSRFNCIGKTYPSVDPIFQGIYTAPYREITACPDLYRLDDIHKQTRAILKTTSIFVVPTVDTRGKKLR